MNDISENSLLKQQATKVAVGVAFFLAILKFFVGILSGSLAILASAVDSLFDLFISLGNSFGVKQADAAPTNNFRYGFGKIEGVMGLFQGVFIIGIGGGLFYMGVMRLLDPVLVQYLWEGVGVMCLSLGVTYFLVFYLSRVAKQTNSLILAADSAHYKSDLLANFGVLFGLLLVWMTGEVWIDGLISMIISFFIAKEGLLIFKKSLFLLLDREIGIKCRMNIAKILDKSIKKKEITGYHYLRTRQSGSKIFVDVHLVFTLKTLLVHAHDIGDLIESRIKKVIGDEGEVLVHLDPVDDSGEQLDV